jgi:nicotinate-nucleotide pyrophosphorylase (carboxylating)
MAALGSTGHSSPETHLTRGRASGADALNRRVARAFFRGSSLTLENPEYERAVRQLLVPLLQQDLTGGDLTAVALGLSGQRATALVLARQDGVIAGLAEVAMLYRDRGVAVQLETRDGAVIRAGETLLRAEGDQARLLAVERTGLNLLQRMSGIATAALRLEQRVSQAGSATRIVGTRKTPWGLLDKRALHVGGVGTHRLGLGDAILIKNNHLALIADSEEQAAPKAIERAWALRHKSAFIEIEVRREAAARAAAQTFRRLQESAPEEYPCVLMLDNMAPELITRIVQTLVREGVRDAVLVEASGGISESNVGGYAACGADVISVGALTHSACALDLSQRIL